MPTAYFSSHEKVETLEVVFLKPQGGKVALHLLVDSGFTGQSCFVLPENGADLAHAAVPAAQAVGALHGSQKRVVVSSQIPALAFNLTGIAILADTSHLALPPGIQGIVGLRFLRHFHRWGAEQIKIGVWRFFLTTDST
jgi:hypothetical protein